MFGVSVCVLALAALYAWGFVGLMKAGLNAGRTWLVSAGWAVIWPVSGWKMLNDLWKAPPPAAY